MGERVIPEGYDVDARRGHRTTNELVLPKGEFAYTRDNTSGITSVRCGPAVVNAQAQDEPVVFDAATGRFRPIPLVEAAQINTIVPTGHYAVLTHPSADGKYPEIGCKSVDVDLKIGQRVHIPGPISFALWPRQIVKVIEGHQLRSNQYLLVRVYDEQAAKANWSQAVVKKAAVASDAIVDSSAKTKVVAAAALPEDLSVGRLIIIRGTEVSFYIPPTGVEVLQDERGLYVREALTLERLQYCILIDEDGNKRYVRGPAVVFPLPTERFHVNDAAARTFRPIELNGNIQGLHVKVIAPYTDVNGDHGPVGAKYEEGDELFITGETTPIYFPCEQHSAIKYDGKTKHFATAIPAGDARYLLNRHTGVIKMIDGGTEGKMCLPDPRKDVFSRRVLSDAECAAMYPGNEDVLTYNRALREVQTRAPATRKGVVSEGDLLRARVSNSKRSQALNIGAPMAGRALEVDGAEFADASLSNSQTSAEMGGDEFTRQATYTEPRTLTMGLDKFCGVPKINVWTGYAVMVTDTAGNRRVEQGPTRLLLGFNETLEVLALSTGRPKTTDHILKTAYLQINNNKVNDVITAETADHVHVEIKLAARVNFDGNDPTKWFSVANYVKLLTDHVRSVLKARVRSVKIEDFWPVSEDFIRDTILGKKPEGAKRAGMVFEENGMTIYDVEVLSVTIGDAQIQQLLTKAQHETVETNIALAQAERLLDAAKRREDLQRQELKAKAETAEFRAAIQIDEISRNLRTSVARLDNDLEIAKKNLVVQEQNEEIKNASAAADLQRKLADANAETTIMHDHEAVRLASLKEETAATVARLNSMKEGFTEALLALGNQDTMVKIAEAMSVQKFIGGKDLVDVVQKVFAGTPLEKLSELMQQRAGLLPTGRR